MTQSIENPFSSPTKPPLELSESARPGTDVIDFGRLAGKWERYRIVFNAVLVMWTIVINAALLGIFAFWGLLLAIPGALAANFFFFLGPVFDGYCQWIFRVRSKNIGLTILVLGVLFTMLLSGICFVELSLMSKTDPLPNF